MINAQGDFFLIEEEMKKLKFGRDYVPAEAPPPSGGRSRKGRRSGANRSAAGKTEAKAAAAAE